MRNCKILLAIWPPFKIAIGEVQVGKGWDVVRKEKSVVRSKYCESKGLGSRDEDPVSPPSFYGIASCKRRDRYRDLIARRPVLSETQT